MTGITPQSFSLSCGPKNYPIVSIRKRCWSLLFHRDTALQASFGTLIQKLFRTGWSEYSVEVLKMVHANMLLLWLIWTLRVWGGFLQTLLFIRMFVAIFFECG
jgi:hypothetical protein